MARRISAIFLLLFSIIFLPFWVSALLGIGFMAYFSIFFEAVVLFFIVDLLYGVPEVKFYGITYTTLIVFTLVLWGIEFLKKRLKYYPK